MKEEQYNHNLQNQLIQTVGEDVMKSHTFSLTAQHLKHIFHYENMLN